MEAQGQQSIVCHPVCSGAVISILFAPLAVGSYWAVPVLRWSFL